MTFLTLVNADDLLGWSMDDEVSRAHLMHANILEDLNWGVSPLYDLFLKKLGFDPSTPPSPGPGRAADGIIG